jgi:methyl-accepting chemotaxis protein
MEISDSMNKMANGANEINSAVAHANEITKKTQGYIETLFGEVSRFKVE